VYVCDTYLQLSGESVVNGARFKEANIKQNSVLQLRLHRDKIVSIVLDGKTWALPFVVSTQKNLSSWLLRVNYNPMFCSLSTSKNVLGAALLHKFENIQYYISK
jgi:hypothetical protein